MLVNTVMVLDRVTKGAVRYQEVGANDQPLKGDEGTINTLYIRKAAIEGAVPERILVKIEAA